MDILYGPQLSKHYAGDLPGASGTDNDLWHRWRGVYAIQYDHFFANVRLILPQPALPDTPEWARHALELNAAKRVDLLAYHDSQIDVIEIRANAGLSALGQALGYTALLRSALPPAWKINPVIATDRVEMALAMACTAYGVHIHGV